MSKALSLVIKFLYAVYLNIGITKELLMDVVSPRAVGFNIYVRNRGYLVSKLLKR